MKNSLEHPSDEYRLQRCLQGMRRSTDTIAWGSAFIREQLINNPNTAWHVTDQGKRYLEQQLPHIHRDAFRPNIDVQKCISISLDISIYTHLIEYDYITIQEIFSIIEVMDPPALFNQTKYINDLMNSFEIFGSKKIAFMQRGLPTPPNDSNTREGVRSLFANS